MIDLHQLSKAIARLSLEQKAQLLDFVRNQSTESLEEALDEIVALLKAMGVMTAELGLESQSTRDRLEALKSIQGLL